jgi:hypothetical protein
MSPAPEPHEVGVAIWKRPTAREAELHDTLEADREAGTG